MSFQQEMQRDQHAAIQAELREVWMRAWLASIAKSDTTSYGATEIADKCLNAYTERFGA
jgi:hypothetical protein